MGFGQAMKPVSLIEGFIEHRGDILARLQQILKSQEVSEDVAQDLFLRLQHRPSDVAIANIRGYLLRAAHNLAIDRLRAERRHDLVREAATQVFPDEREVPSVEDQVLARAELEHLAKHARMLPARARQVFYLKRFEGRSNQEIADAIGVGLTTVYKDLRLALKTLHDARRSFNDDHGTPPSDELQRAKRLGVRDTQSS